MASNLFDLLGIVALIGGAYYIISGGKIPLLQQAATQAQLPTTPEEIIPYGDDMIEDVLDIEKRKTKKKGDFDDSDFYGPPQQMPPMPPPTPQQQRAMMPPAAGLVPSMDYINIPQYPPYVSPTVNTYSPYSPYNQFRAYQQYYTTPTGQISLTPDDNVGFTDIDTSKPRCTSCKTECMSNRFGYRCMSCRPGCKTFTHQYIPAQQGWGIGPAPGGFSGNYAFLAESELGDTVSRTGEPRTKFVDMEDYNQKRRFDPHNKLKRRVRGMDNRFVTPEDYYYSTRNPHTFDINVE